MSKSIYKYPLQVRLDQSIEMPLGAKILSLQVQHGQATIWALVETSRLTRPRKFKMYCTGDELILEQGYEFVGTVQISQGAFVFHVFDGGYDDIKKGQ